MKFLKSVQDAIRGLSILIRSQQNVRIHLLVAALVFVAAWWFSVSAVEWLVLIVLVGGIVALEAVNTIFEQFIDALSPRFAHITRDLKDMMAGAVLIGAITAVVIGLLIFPPRVLHFLYG
jgi:diacylglycerol kinase